jgi:hypothetical protein
MISRVKIDKYIGQNKVVIEFYLYQQAAEEIKAGIKTMHKTKEMKLETAVSILNALEEYRDTDDIERILSDDIGELL